MSLRWVVPAAESADVGAGGQHVTASKGNKHERWKKTGRRAAGQNCG